MPDLPSTDVEADDPDYDVTIPEGQLFIMDAVTFFQENNIEAVWNSLEQGPYALVKDKGLVTFTDLYKKPALRPVK